MRLKIGVMGSASGPLTEDPELRNRCREVGRWIARHDCIMVTGACPGLPYDATLGAKEEGGFVFGVSPAFSRNEHEEEYRSPGEGFDIILFTGMGFMERDIVNIRSSDGLIFLAGGMGSLNEFTVAYEEGKPMGFLTGGGGIADHIPEIIQWTDREMHPNLVFSADPQTLVEKMIEILHRYPMPIHEDGRVKDVKFGKLRG